MIVLDTHAWIWTIDSPDLLGEQARSAVRRSQEAGELYISSISAWEIYMLVNRGRLHFGIPVEVWVNRCEQLSFCHFVPVNNEISRIAVNSLKDMHSDPADRIIAATALYIGATLVTKDRKLRESKTVKTLW